MAKAKSKKPEGLEAWLPKEGSPHLRAYSNLLRNGYSKKKAYDAIKRELIASGMIKVVKK